MIADYQLCVEPFSLNVLAGTTTTFYIPVDYAVVLNPPDPENPCASDPCSYDEMGSGCGRIGSLPSEDCTLTATAYTDNPSGTLISGVSVAWSSRDNGGSRELVATVTVAPGTPNGTDTARRVRLKGDEVNSSGLTTSQLILNPSIVVQSVYEKAALFTFPHSGLGGGFYISNTDICTNTTEVDASLSLSAMYRVLLVGKLTDGAINNLGGWSSTSGIIKLVDGSVPSNEVWSSQSVSAYPLDWYNSYGDPFGESTPYEKLRLVGDRINPPEIPSFQYSYGFPPSSAYQNTSLNFQRLGGHIYYTIGGTQYAIDVVDRPIVRPYVRSVVSTDGTSGGVPQTVGEGYFERLVGNSVTLYPAVANDNRVLSAIDMLSMEVATSASGPWYAFGAPQVTGYTYSLNDPSIVFNYDDGTDAFDYTAARLIFTPTAAGNYYLRVKPTADANPNVRSTQTIHINAASTPVTSVVLGPGATGQTRNDAFFVNVTTSCSAGTYQIALVNPPDDYPYGSYLTGPSDPHDAIELYVDGVLRGTLGSTNAYFPLDGSTPFSGTVGSGRIQLKIPAYVAGSPKLTSQAFSHIVSLKAVLNGTEFLDASPVNGLTYNRVGATISINGTGNQASLTPCGSDGATPTTTTFTRTVSWKNLAADTLIELSSPLAASNGVITYSPQSFTPAAPNLVSGSQVVTCTYTHPAPVVSVIVDTTIVATATPSVGDPFTSVGTLKIFPCATEPGIPSINYYKPATDKGIVFTSAQDSGVSLISSILYSNTGPFFESGDSATEDAYTDRAYFKLVVDGNPDTVNGYTIEASTSPTFSTVTTLIVPSAASNSTWSGSILIDGAIEGTTLFVSRGTGVRGTYVANELLIRVSSPSSDPITSPFPVYYFRAKITGQASYSNTRSVTHIARPYIAMADSGQGVNNPSTNLYLEAGSGFLVCPSVVAITSSGTPVYYSSSGSPLFTIEGSAGLLQTSKTSIFPYPLVPSRPHNTRYMMWGVVDPGASGDHTLNVMFGSVAIAKVSCKVVATNHVNLRIGGSVDASTTVRGTQASPTYNAVAVPGTKTFVVIDGAGTAIPPVVGTLQFTPTLSHASPAYVAILFNQPDPLATSDANGKTSVAASTILTSVSGCSLVESTTPSRLRVVPAVEGQVYPPYTLQTQGIRIPSTFNVGGSELAVTDCNFGLVKGVTGTGTEIPLNISGDSKHVGYPTVGLAEYAKFEITHPVVPGPFFLGTTDHHGLLLGSTGITSIVMELKITLGSAGCLAITKTIPIVSEQCVQTGVTSVDLDALSKSLYSCDVYPKVSPSTGGGAGYDTGLTNPSFISVYENGYPMVSPEFDSTHIPKYGLEFIGSVMGTAGSPSSLNPVKYTANASNPLEIVVATNNGSPACTKKLYKVTYNNDAVSAWLPKPTRFFVGATSSTPLLQVQNLYDNDVLWIQLQNTVDPLIGAKLGSDYRLVFTNIATGVSLSPKTIGSNYYVSGDGAGFTQPNCIKFIPSPSDGFATGATYAVSVMHAATSCAYTAYSVGSAVGTVTYRGQKVAATVTIPALTLYPCFTSVLVTATGTGLSTIKKFSVFEVTNTTTAIAGWDKLPTGTASGNTIPFTLPANGAFPTVRTAAQSKTFKVQFYTADDIALLPITGLATLTMSLVQPQFEIVQSCMETSPTIGTPIGDYQNVFTVRSVGSTCCSSCSSGNCVPDPLTSTDPNSTVVWTSSLPAWLANTTPVGALPNTYRISNSAPIPGTSGSVQVTARVKYYGLDRIVVASYTLTPTSAFSVSTTTLPPTTNGFQNYSAFIGTVNKPCANLQWNITNRSVSGATRSLPPAVTIAVDAGNANRAKITWPVVSDPGAVFPATYKFRVRAQCVGGAQIAEGDVQLVVTPSTPIITSVTPVVGYFDVVNDTVTLTGTSFSSVATVKFDNSLATDVVVNPAGTSITCTPPVIPDSGGPDVLMSVSVENGDGGVYTFPQKYTYTRKLTPVLVGISPSSGTPLGGTKVLLTGANFEPSSVVTIDGIEQPIIAVTPSSLLFVTFPHSVGDVDVVVSNSNCGGAQVECPSIPYTFRVSPQITAVYPYSTSATGQDPVFIVGTGFYATESAKPRVLVDNFEIPASLIRLVAGVG